MISCLKSRVQYNLALQASSSPLSSFATSSSTAHDAHLSNVFIFHTFVNRYLYLHSASTLIMNSLKVPDSGLLLEGPSHGESAAPKQAFSLSLPDEVVQKLAQSALNGDDISISLGRNPVRSGDFYRPSSNLR